MAHPSHGRDYTRSPGIGQNYNPGFKRPTVADVKKATLKVETDLILAIETTQQAALLTSSSDTQATCAKAWATLVRAAALLNPETARDCAIAGMDGVPALREPGKEILRDWASATSAAAAAVGPRASSSPGAKEAPKQ